MSPTPIQKKLKKQAKAISKTLDKLAENQKNGKTSPVETGRLRIETLTHGIRELAETCGIKLKKTTLRADGDLLVSAEHPKYPNTERCGAFDEEFTRLLNLVETRGGSVRTKGYVIPQNGWLFINHFDLEKLIRATGKEA